jgi:hypothetical protein
MTRLQAVPKQRVPFVSHSSAGTWQPSPLDVFSTMQVAIEGAHEEIEETQALRPISEEAAGQIVLWAAEDSLDWDRLIDKIDGWGTPEP